MMMPRRFNSVALQQIAEVGDDVVDAEHIVFGEHQAGIDDDRVIAVLDDHHVLADFPQPANRDYAKYGIVHSCAARGVKQIRLRRNAPFQEMCSTASNKGEIQLGHVL